MRSFLQKTAFIFLLVAIGHIAKAQMKVGDNPTTINAGALLELEATNKGLLFPRITLTKTTIWGLAGNMPVKGMVIYNTQTTTAGLIGTSEYPTIPGDGTGLYYWDGLGWVGTKAGSGITVDLRLVGTNNHITQDAGVGSNGTTAGIGPDNIAIGINTLSSNTTGYGNIALGKNNLTKNTGGYSNTAIGYEALISNTTGDNNIALGRHALAANKSGNSLIGIGWTALISTSDGEESIAIGKAALYNMQNANNNVAIGNAASYSLKTGNYNTAVGNKTLNYSGPDGRNTAIGYSALNSNKGNGNTGVGNMSMFTNTIGNNNTAIGNEADVLLPIGIYNYATAIGAGAKVNASNALVLGGTDAATQVSVGMGTNAPANKLHIIPVTGLDPVKIEGLNDGIGTEKAVVVGTDGVLKKTTYALGAEPWYVAKTAATDPDVPATLNTDNIYQTGKVGINKYNPAYQLDVNGMFNQVVTVPAGGVDTEARTNTMHSGDNVINSAGLPLPASAVITGIGFTSKTATGPLAALSLGNQTATGGEKNAASLSLTNFADKNANISLEEKTSGDHEININTQNGANFTSATFKPSKLDMFVSDGTANNNFVIDPLNLSSTGYPATRDDSGISAPINFLYTDNAGKFLSAPMSAIKADLRLVGINNHITQDAGVGNNGTSVGATGTDNVAIGNETLTANTSGSYNAAIGTKALNLNTTGQFNTAIGWEALASNTTARYNTAIGLAALHQNTTGENNTAIGLESQYYTTGSANIGLGFRSLYANSVGSNNTAIGDQADVLANNLSYATAIGSGATVGISNALVLGGPSGNAQTQTSVGIGTSSPANKLHVVPVTNLDPVKIEGLNNAIGGEMLLVAGTDGVLKKTTDAYQKVDLRLIGSNNHITQDAGVGNNGASLGTRAVNNIAIGEGTLATVGIDDGLAVSNIAMGHNALNLLESGQNFIAIGGNVFGETTSGQSNIGIGSGVGNKLHSNIDNTLIGVNSLSTALSGQYTTTLGYNTLKNHTASLNNTAIGFEAMVETTLGDFNTAVGEKAMTGLERGEYNTALGASTTFTTTFPKYSTAIGAGATVSADNVLVLGGITGTVAQTSVGLGTAAPANKLHIVPETGLDPVKIEGLNPAVGNENIIVAGADGVLKKTTVSFSPVDLRLLPDGKNNHITQDAGVGSNGTAVGTGKNTIAIGKDALSSNTSGESNIAIGSEALKGNTDGLGNIAIGEQALTANTNGLNSAAIGNQALLGNTTGENNTAFGNVALYQNTTGVNNTAIGVSSLIYNLTGNNNTALGYNAGVSPTPTQHNYATAIGAFAQVNASNAIVLGGPLGSLGSANVGIGTSTPTNKLHVVADATLDPIRFEGLSDGSGAANVKPVIITPDGRLLKGIIHILKVITDYSITQGIGDATWVLDPSGGTVDITITLPAMATQGTKHYIKAINNSAHAAKINGFIDGNPTNVITLGLNSAMILQFFDNQWIILSKYN